MFIKIVISSTGRAFEAIRALGEAWWEGSQFRLNAAKVVTLLAHPADQ